MHVSWFFSLYLSPASSSSPPKTFWRCSVCRRRGASAPSATPGATTTSGGASAAGGRPSAVPANLAQQRWSEEKPSSLSAISTTEEYGRKARSASAVALVPVPPGSAPTTRRRGTSAAVDSNLELKNIQQQASTSRGYGHSAEDVRLNVNGRASGNGGRKTSTCALPSASISASESSPEDGMDHRGGGSRRGSYRAGERAHLLIPALELWKPRGHGSEPFA